jgi:hypothetical protein
MIIDCASCVARPTECGDCVISVVLGPTAGGVDLDADEQTAVAVLAGSGLVPPLRLMPASEAATGSGAPGAPGAPGSPGTPVAPGVSAAPGAVQDVRARVGTKTHWSRRQRAG